MTVGSAFPRNQSGATRRNWQIYASLIFLSTEKKSSQTDEMHRAIVDFPRRVQVGSRTVRIQQRLGNGAFGVVYKVKDEASSTVHALKDVLCLNASALHNAIREAITLNKISHQNVIAIMGADKFRDRKGLHMLLLMEYCSSGSLNDRLARPSSEQMNMKWICQTAAALAHLHSRGVVHRDLKADNVLLTETEDVKLADFGLAREYTALKRIDVHRDGGSWIASYEQYYMNSGVGPVHWVAPEFFTGRYSEKADVFSLGTLFFAILERDFIVIEDKAIYGAFVDFHGVGKLGLGFAMANVDSTISIAFSSHAQGLRVLQSVVIEALQYDSKNRPSAKEIYDKVMTIHRIMIWIQEPQQQFRFRNNSSRSSSSNAATRNATHLNRSIRCTVSSVSSISSTVDFSNNSRSRNNSFSRSSSSSSSNSSHSISSTDSSDSTDLTSSARFNNSIRSSNTYSRTSHGRVVKPTARVTRAIMIAIIRQLLGRGK